ncbi:hypothetical protein VQ643_12450 [Pseudomonas sp. F1_0610]|uniref:hypothetical protein n=1 Tax=Pseudomonas sp. F1_0610 TaxID=3114284 RepID=UPI0039C333D7
MTTLSELAEQIYRLYPLEDRNLGKRYRIVDQLGGTTELEEVSGTPRYVSTRNLQDPSLWKIYA